MHWGRAPTEWEPNHVWEVASSLSVISQPAGQRKPGLCRGPQRPSAPGPFSTSCAAPLSPSFQLGIRSNRGHDCPSPALFLGGWKNCIQGLVWFLRSGNLGWAPCHHWLTVWSGSSHCSLWASGHLAANGNKRITTLMVTMRMKSN